MSTKSIDARLPATKASHRTITALDGAFPPLVTDSNWLANPGTASKLRIYADIVLRGTTALGDAPQVTVQPYLRSGGSAGSVGAGTSVQLTRPRLKDLSSIKLQKTVNDGAGYTNYSANVIDNSNATTADLDSLDTLANGDWFIIGGPVPFCGVAIDMDAGAVNATAVTLLAQYWDGDSWESLPNVTDGTIVAATKTLSGDGQITWSMPTDWAASTINSISSYWARFTVSAAIGADVEIEECDLLLPIKAAIDVQCDGDDVLIVLESQDASVTGTVAYSGALEYTWR